MKMTKYFIEKLVRGKCRDLGVVRNPDGTGGTFPANLVISIKFLEDKRAHVDMYLVSDKGKKLMKYADITLEDPFRDTLTVAGLKIEHGFNIDKGT